MKNLEILAPIQFERKGVTLYGVVDEFINGEFTAVYSHGEVWGGLVLRPENNVRTLDEYSPEARIAYESARTYCTREIASMAAYGDDEHAMEIAAHVQKTLDGLNAILVLVDACNTNSINI